MNTERMRRYIARGTPNQISRIFDDLNAEAVYREYREFETWFREQMAIKYPRGCDIQVFSDRALALGPWQTAITMRAIPPRR